MLNIRPVVHLLGLLACFLALLLCIPALTDAIYHDKDWEPFTAAALTTGFIGFGAAIARCAAAQCASTSAWLRIKTCLHRLRKVAAIAARGGRLCRRLGAAKISS